MRDFFLAVNKEAKSKMNPDQASEYKFSGQCGKAQSILYHAFRDVSLNIKPLAIQSLEVFSLDRGHFGHAVSVARKGDRHYLLDPTFV